MSRIDELIDELCPDGVLFRELGDVIVLKFGTRITKRNEIGSAYPVYGGGGESFRTIDFNREDDYVISRFAMSARCVRKVSGKFWMLDSGFTFELASSDVLKAYIGYWLFNNQVRIYACSSQGAQKNLRTDDFKRLRIPVPPVEVQREIVAILDTLAELDAELEAELEGRRQLRLAIRDQFLSSGRIDGWPPIRLSEIAMQYVEPVKVESETSYVNLGVRWYGEGAFAREAHQGREIKAKTLYRVKANQFIYNRMFVTEGSFGLITPELAHGVVSNEFPVFDLDPNRVVPEWLYIRFQDSNLVKRIANEAEGGTKSRRRWKEDRFADFEINLPPIDVQREIVRVLSACADMEANLNSERLKRRQQYEYYRNRLLTFEEAPA